MNKMESDERYRRAKRRVGVLKGFYIHLVKYLCNDVYKLDSGIQGVSETFPCN